MWLDRFTIGGLFLVPKSLSLIHISYDSNIHLLIFLKLVQHYSPKNPQSPQWTTAPPGIPRMEVKSELTLSSVSAAWATTNKASLAAALKKTLKLRKGEELFITSITKARRQRRMSSIDNHAVGFWNGNADAADFSFAKRRIAVCGR